jgi:hypothetical protein
MQKLLVLWLVLTTEVGGEGSLYYSQLTDTATGAETRAELAQTLGLDVNVVTHFVNMTNASATRSQIADVQDLFHNLVKATDPASYSGPECPFSVTTITDLLPA